MFALYFENLIFSCTLKANVLVKTLATHIKPWCINALLVLLSFKSLCRPSLTEHMCPEGRTLETYTHI